MPCGQPNHHDPSCMGTKLFFKAGSIVTWYVRSLSIATWPPTKFSYEHHQHHDCAAKERDNATHAPSRAQSERRQPLRSHWSLYHRQPLHTTRRPAHTCSAHTRTARSPSTHPRHLARRRRRRRHRHGRRRLGSATTLPPLQLPCLPPALSPAALSFALRLALPPAPSGILFHKKNTVTSEGVLRALGSQDSVPLSYM